MKLALKLPMSKGSLSHSPHFNFQKFAFFSTRSYKKEDDFLKHQIDPHTNKTVKAAFSRIEDQEKSKFGVSSCLVTLSIGQPIHEGPYLAATLSLVNKHFNSCTFVLGDTLQRHTMGIMRPSHEEDLLQEAENKGDAWLHNNINLLSKLRIPWNVRRWNHWLEHKRFKELLSHIEKTYESEQAYRNQFKYNIEEYLNRLKSRNELQMNEAEAHKRCLDYLQEECAAMCLWLEEKCQYELYANGRTLAMQATYMRFIETLHPDLLNPISLRFKKKELFDNEFVDDTTEEVKSGAAQYLLR